MLPFATDRSLSSVYGLDKVQLSEIAERLVRAFLTKNGSAHPTINLKADVKAESRGWFMAPWAPRDQPTVTVYVRQDAHASKGAPMAWSFPGYVADATAVGVLAHEVGHYLDWSWVSRGCFDPKWRKNKHYMRASASKEWRALLRAQKKPMSGYEPDAAEALAETLRLFQTNPRLLQAVREDRFDFVTDFMGLVPDTTKGRTDPLKALTMWGASDNILNAAKRRLGH